MKLFFAVGSFFPDNSGGPNITMYWLSKALVTYGCRVSILTTDRGIEAGISRNRWHDVNYGNVKYVRTLKNDLPFHLFWLCLLELRRQKTIYLASFFYPLSFVLAPIAVLLGKQVIWAPRGEASEAALQFGANRKKFIIRLIRRFRKKIIFHATSEAEVEDIRKVLGECRIVMIPVGMELPAPEQSVSTTSNLLFLGRLHPIKGLENLLEAIAQSKSFQNKQRMLILAGYSQHGYDQVLSKKMEALGIQDQVKMIGRVDGQAKNSLLAGAYALVLPSFSENFGAVVAEALAQGTPCIVSTGAPWAILQTGGAGYHVPNDPASLCTAIDTIYELSVQDYEQMRANARLIATEHLDINKQIPQWIQLINQAR